MFIKSAFSYNYVNNYSRTMQYIMISFILLTNICFSRSNTYFPFCHFETAVLEPSILLKQSGLITF